MKGLSPAEIAAAEQDLIEEGLLREEIQRLCDVHLAVFREALERQRPAAPPATPSTS